MNQNILSSKAFLFQRSCYSMLALDDAKVVIVSDLPPRARVCSSVKIRVGAGKNTVAYKPSQSLNPFQCSLEEACQIPVKAELMGH
jgi:hypothetical protein